MEGKGEVVTTIYSDKDVEVLINLKHTKKSVSCQSQAVSFCDRAHCEHAALHINFTYVTIHQKIYLKAYLQ